ncbi:universal stress protein [Mangrovimonas sp. YM274]|uniref:universal stress protein n=1 Tax=Mangrovimonas sp. YM274 TaxID=3070660 RepID=UPI0027DE9367|nr:universal stress protein [Mangrovimonas sp. YM274]WMI70146.1 universal stress protein [Mangrovimonas sp. YM274]
MKTILLLTDFSQNSINAIHYALNLFRNRDVNYYLLHVKSASAYTTDDLMASGPKPLYQSLIEPAKKKLATLVDTLQGEFNLPKGRIEYMVDFDILTNSIQQVINSKAIDIVIMGTNGATGAKEIIFGSNTINVIRKVNCTTLVIPEGFAFRPPNNLVLPLDGETSLKDTAFTDGIIPFVTNYSKTLHVLRVEANGSREETQKQLEDQNILKTLNHNINYQYHTINNVPVYFAAHSYIQTQPIDLVTLITHKERFFERYLSTSSTSRISNNLILPLLIFHGH